jgi:hypothetical protein
MVIKGSRRSWALGFLGSLPQIFLAVLLLLQSQGSSGGDADIQSNLGVFASVLFLFWSLVACGLRTLWSGTRSMAGALARGSIAGFVLAVVVAFAA